MSSDHFFEILIGTYNRPHQAMRAIQSASLFDNVLVRCNSNGYEAILEEFCSKKDNVIYTYFETNQGAFENWTFLLKSSKSKFCMLLSDEDEIDPRHFLDFYDLLKSNSDVTGAIVPFYDRSSDRILNTIGKELCSVLSKNFLVYRSYNFRGYMSGFVFHTGLVQDLLIKNNSGTFSYRHEYDDYLHVRLLRKMLDYGNILAINSPIVIRNPDAGYGGDSHSHIVNSKGPDSLNPNIYSIYSRARQYLFSVHLLFQEDWSFYKRLLIHLQIFMKILGVFSRIGTNKRFAFQEIRRAQTESGYQIVGIDKLLPYVVRFKYVQVITHSTLLYFFRILGFLSSRKNFLRCKHGKL